VPRRLLLIPALLAALALPAPAAAVVNGDAAAQGAYPGVAFVGRNTDGTGPLDEYCAGTLVGSRQILTAARCAVYGLGQDLPEEGFEVRLGDVDLADATVHPVANNEVHPEYDDDTGANDVAMLTLEDPVDLPPVRVVEATETARWAAGTPARVLGWGEFNSGSSFLSTYLRVGDVTVSDDAGCADPDLRVCAAGAEENPCEGDSGSPLLVPDGALFALAGVFSGDSCATTGAPGLFARVGDEPLSAWVHERTPEADFDLSHQPRANEAVTFTSTSTHPEGANYFTTFRWDLDNDGEFDDATGRSISHTYTQVGEAVAGLEASRANGDVASIYYAFDVMVLPGGTTTTTTPPPSTNPTATVVPARLATILNARRPKVRRGRFAIRVRFARTAPRGTAVVEVYRASRRIGIARTRVRRGATRRVRVKLTPTGRRLLRRDANGRMRVRVRVRVGRTVLRSKRLTIRR
jgi:hypothetical protein